MNPIQRLRSTPMSTDLLLGADPYVPGHGDLRYAVAEYVLDLDYTMATNQLAGRAVLTCTILTPTASLDLDLSGLRVLTVRAEGATIARHTHRGKRLTVRFSETLPADQVVTLTITTKGNPRPLRGIGGTAGWEELTDGVIVASQPHGSPSWFPCNDRASDKARYTITIACDPAYTVICNGRLVDRRKAGRKTAWTWVQNEPMAPYLATVQIGRYQLRTQTPEPTAEPATNTPCLVAGPARLRAAIDTAFADQPRMMGVFEQAYGAYPFAGGYTAVITDDPLEIPLESQTLSTFGANFTNRTWESQRLIAHEMAHQWWGNSVTAARWSDIWLHEGPACYSEWIWSPHAGHWSTQEWASHHWQRLARGPQRIVLAAPGAHDMFDDLIYKRGALTLHALRCEVGDAAFFEVLRTFQTNHRYAVVTGADFESHASVVTGKRLGPLFDAWLRQAALPPLPVLRSGVSPS